MKSNIIIKCLALDDEPMALEKLENYIPRIPYLELVKSCVCPNEAMEVIAEYEVDAIFVDVNMPDVNGMDFIKNLQDPPMVVFVSAYAEYAAESYKLRAVDYLLKPYTFEDFQKTAEYLRQNYETSMQNSTFSEDLFLKVDYRYVRVELKDIVYIEGMNEYLRFHLVSGDPLLVHITFKQLSGHFPENFLQVHRSYMVNMNHVVEVERSTVLLDNGKRISVSDGSRDTFLAYISQKSLKK